jgi:glycine/D-amino acid oxidase-like deaminating enzyme
MEMPEYKLKIIISGAGIAGLCTAIALRRLPFVNVELYERAGELKEIGASIALSPNVSHQLPHPNTNQLHSMVKLIVYLCRRVSGH